MEVVGSYFAFSLSFTSFDYYAKFRVPLDCSAALVSGVERPLGFYALLLSTLSGIDWFSTE